MILPQLTNLTTFQNRNKGTFPPDSAILLGDVRDAQDPKAPQAQWALGNAPLHITFHAETPSPLMNPGKLPAYAADPRTLLKSQWHEMVKSPEALAKLLTDRGLAPDTIVAEVQKTQDLFAKHFPQQSPQDVREHYRQFGMGTHVMLQLEDGAYAMVVKRHADKKASGIVLDPDRYACAGGMADDDLLEAQSRELGEEAFVLVDRGTHFDHLTFAPVHDWAGVSRLRTDFIASVADYKAERLQTILADKTLADHPTIRAILGGKPVHPQTLPLHLVRVPEIARTMTYTLPTGDARSMIQYVDDDKLNGNINVCTYGVARLTGVKAANVTVFDDELPDNRRAWFLMTPDKLNEERRTKGILCASYVNQLLAHQESFDRITQTLSL